MTRYVDDFEFSPDFGFTGSSEGPPRAQAQRITGTAEMGDAQTPGYAKGGKKMHKAAGGPVADPSQPTISMPMSTAARMAQGLVQKGAQVGRAQAMHGARPGGGAPMMMRGAPPGRGGAPMPSPAYPAAQGAGMPMGGALSGVGNGPPGSAAPQIPGAGPSAATPPGLKGGGKFLKTAIKHPGRETERARESGRSVHAQLEHDSHSKDPSIRGAGNLGLRFQSHEFGGKKKR